MRMIKNPISPKAFTLKSLPLIVISSFNFESKWISRKGWNVNATSSPVSWMCFIHGFITFLYFDSISEMLFASDLSLIYV